MNAADPPAAGIDDAFVPRVKANVAIVELDGEGVVMDGDTGRLHLLDEVATVVWGCLDGAASIGQLAGDLAESFGTPLPTVRRDVVALVRQLVAAGLLEDAVGIRPGGYPSAHPGGGKPEEGGGR